MNDIDKALEALERLKKSAGQPYWYGNVGKDVECVRQALERQRELTEALRTTTDYLAWGSVHIPGYAGVEITRQVMANEKMLAAAPTPENEDANK